MRSLFRADPTLEPADLAYDRVVAQARRPAFFLAGGVPDTLDGRYELICLHAFLYLNRLKREGQPGKALGQSFFDRMFVDFDRGLREMGTGDLSVGRQIKRMAQGFYGRIQAYETGLAGTDEALKAALTRNLYGTVADPIAALDAMARYFRNAAAALRRQDSASVLLGRVAFPAPFEETDR